MLMQLTLPLKRKSNNTNDTIKADNFMEICTSQFVPLSLKFFDKKDIKMKKISILGCGWLGFPWRKQYWKGISVNGSTTSQIKFRF
jgi:hypothetical protein